MNCNIRRDVRVCFTKLRLSSHKFLVERARWLKVKVPYTQRTCTLCNSNDIEDGYHVTLVCEYFRDVRKKYIKPFYYQRPNMMKFLDLMTSVIGYEPADLTVHPPPPELPRVGSFFPYRCLVFPKKCPQRKA